MYTGLRTVSFPGSAASPDKLDLIMVVAAAGRPGFTVVI